MKQLHRSQQRSKIVEAYCRERMSSTQGFFEDGNRSPVMSLSFGVIRMMTGNTEIIETTRELRSCFLRTHGVAPATVRASCTAARPASAFTQIAASSR